MKCTLLCRNVKKVKYGLLPLQIICAGNQSAGCSGEISPSTTHKKPQNVAFIYHNFITKIITFLKIFQEKSSRHTSLTSVCMFSHNKDHSLREKKSCEDLYHVIIRTTLRQFSSPNVTCLAGRYNPSTRLFPPGRGQKIRPLRYGGKIPGPGLPYALAEVSKNSQVAVRCCNR